MGAFALGGLIVSASLSVLTFLWARTYLVDQRESSAVHQAQVNAQFVRTQLHPSSVDISGLLTSLQTPSTAESLVYRGGRWFGTSATAGPNALPSGLRELVLVNGQAGRQRYQKGSARELAVGIPLSGGNAYFEIFSLADLASTLRTLRDSLAAGSLAGFGVSLAIGAWATRRVLRPVRDIGAAAQAIASGHLDARLDAQGDQELAELATGFNSMVDSLQARIEQDARFASDVSHELRSPLTTLQSAVEIMQRRRDQLDTKAARALDLLSDEVVRFSRLVENLLEISRYDAGVARLELEPVDVVVLSKGLLADAGQPVTVASNTDSTTILADRRRLQQSLRNLIANAVVHAGGVTSLVVTIDDEWIRIAVEDRGPGIADDDRETIFERFARGKAAGRRSSGGGVGLGLSLVAEHIRLQGGKVEVEDAEPVGSRFVVLLPTRRP